MNTTIYYFSGTGNSLKVAKDLSDQLDAKIIKISHKNMFHCEDTQSDVIGFVFPVYFVGIPIMLKNFLENLQMNKKAYVFAIATYGGNIGGPFKEINRILHQKNMALSAEFTILMPGNNILMPDNELFYDIVSEETQTKLLEAVPMQIQSIASAVKEKQKVRYKVGMLMNVLSKPLSSALFKPQEKDKFFWTDERCNGCGICSKVCPANNIVMKDGKPTWEHQCEACVACIQWCPQRSLQYKKVTPNRERYHHPEIELKEFIVRE